MWPTAVPTFSISSSGTSVCRPPELVLSTCAMFSPYLAARPYGRSGATALVRLGSRSWRVPRRFLLLRAVKPGDGPPGVIDMPLSRRSLTRYADPRRDPRALDETPSARPLRHTG